MGINQLYFTDYQLYFNAHYLSVFMNIFNHKKAIIFLFM